MTQKNKEVWSWAMYDWANSAFATTVMAGFFPLFFKAYWADPDYPLESTFYLGMANSIASIIVALFAPFLGAIADQGGAKKKFLFSFAYLGIIMTGGLWFVEKGYWQMAVLFYVFAALGFSGSNIFYDSILPSIASEKKVDYVSSLGFGMGYIGGGILFMLNVFMYLKHDLFGIPDGPTAIRLSFVTVALWWAVFSIPVAIWVKEPEINEIVGIFPAVSLGWKQLSGTFKEIRHMKVVGLFLLAYWFYIDGVDTIVKMAVDYGVSLNFSDSAMITALLLVQFIAFPSALLFSLLSKKIGVKESIMAGIIGYTIITFLAYFMSQMWHMFILAGLVGIFQGGIQALSRSLYTRIIPKDKSAEFFGFYNMLGKFAAVIGPAMMGTITLLTGNIRYGILSILVLFILGGFFLLKVNIQEGSRIANEYLSK